MNQFEYKRASTLADAIASLGRDNKSAFLAGGTNLIDLMKRNVTAPEKLVDINALPLNQVEQTKNGLRIGALARNSDVAENALVQQYFPLLSQALKAGASPQLRNMASTGGNMMQRTRCPYFYDTALPCNKREPGSGCGAMQGYNRMHAIFGTSEKCIAVHPSDMCIALAALEATVNVTNGRSERTIKFTDFHRLPGDMPQKDNNLMPGEMIIGIDIPFNKYAANSAYLKVRDRASYAFALVSAGVALEMDGSIIKDARIALGGVAHKPWRFTEAELYLKGKEASETNFYEAARISMQGAKGFGENNFKLKMAPATVVTCLKTASEK